MPNWCMTSITFKSDNKNKIQALGKVFKELMREQHSYVHTGKFMEAHGYTREQYDDLVDFRDTFSYVGEAESYDDGSWILSCEAETAWSSYKLLTIIAKVLSEKYDDEIKAIYISEEQGQELFIKNDELGEFYPDNYVLDYEFDYGEDRVYFTTYDELISYIKNTFPDADVADGDDIDTIKRKVESNYECSWFNLYNFEIENI